jgi:hypothetical protein
LPLDPQILSLLNANNKILGIPALPSILAPLPQPTATPFSFKPPGMKQPGGFKTRAGMVGNGPVAVILKHARQFGLDPAAVLAYALEESNLNPGAVGDHGTSFGVFQAHIGGAAGNR